MIEIRIKGPAGSGKTQVARAIVDGLPDYLHPVVLVEEGGADITIFREEWHTGRSYTPGGNEDDDEAVKNAEVRVVIEQEQPGTPADDTSPHPEFVRGVEKALKVADQACASVQRQCGDDAMDGDSDIEQEAYNGGGYEAAMACRRAITEYAQRLLQNPAPADQKVA